MTFASLAVRGTADFDDLTRGFERASGSVGDFTDRLAEVDPTGFAQVINVIEEGVTLLADATERGGRVITVFEAFNRTLGATEGSMQGLRDATLNTVSDFELMRKANEAFTLGAVRSTQEFTELAGAATRLGRAFGVDTARALDSLSVGIASQSNRLLNNLGVVVDVSEAQESYATSIGVAVSALNEQERATAFQRAAFEEIERVLDRLGDVQRNAGDEAAGLSAAMENLRNTIDRLIASSPLVELFFRRLRENVEDINAFLGGTAPGVEAAVDRIVSGFKDVNLDTATAALDHFTGLLDDVRSQEERLTATQTRLNNALAAGIGDRGKTAQELAAVNAQLAIVQPQVGQLEAIVGRFQPIYTEIEARATAAGNAVQFFARAIPDTVPLAALTKELDKAQDALKRLDIEGAFVNGEEDAKRFAERVSDATRRVEILEATIRQRITDAFASLPPYTPEIVIPELPPLSVPARLDADLSGVNLGDLLLQAEQLETQLGRLRLDLALEDNVTEANRLREEIADVEATLERLNEIGDSFFLDIEGQITPLGDAFDRVRLAIADVEESQNALDFAQATGNAQRVADLTRDVEAQTQAARDAAAQFAGALAVSGVEAGTVADIIEAINVSLGQLPSTADDANRELRDTIDTVERLSRAGVQAAESIGLISDEAADALRSAVDLGAGIARVAAGDLTGLVQAVGGLTGVLGSLFGESPEAAAHRQLIEANNAQLDRLTQGVATLADSFASVQGRTFELVEQAIANALELNIPLGFTNRLENELAALGLTMADAEAVARSLGIELDGSVGSFRQLEQALQTELLDRFLDDFGRQMGLVQTRLDLLDVDDPVAKIDELRKLFLQFSGLDISGRLGFGLADLGTDAGREFAEGILTGLLDRILAGDEAALAQLGDISLDEFIRFVEEFESTVDQLNGTAESAITGVLAKLRQEFALFDVTEPVEQIARLRAELLGFVEGDLRRDLQSVDFVGSAPEEFIRNLLTAIENGTFDIAQLGGLDLEEFLAAITEMERLGDATQELNRQFASAINVVDGFKVDLARFNAAEFEDRLSALDFEPIATDIGGLGTDIADAIRGTEIEIGDVFNTDPIVVAVAEVRDEIRALELSGKSGTVTLNVISVGEGIVAPGDSDAVAYRKVYRYLRDNSTGNDAVREVVAVLPPPDPGA